jgi:hypothetical protein
LFLLWTQHIEIDSKKRSLKVVFTIVNNRDSFLYPSFGLLFARGRLDRHSAFPVPVDEADVVDVLARGSHLATLRISGLGRGLRRRRPSNMRSLLFANAPHENARRRSLVVSFRAELRSFVSATT